MRLAPWFSRWHKSLGAALAVVFIVLAITGIALNHTHELQLDRQRVGWAWLNRLYGLHPGQVSGFRVGERWLIKANDRLYLDAEPVAVCSGALVGAVNLNGLFYAACGRDLLIVTTSGQLVESLAGPQNPARRLGVTTAVVVDTVAGLRQLDEFEGRWQPVAAAEPVTWARAEAPPRALREQWPGELQASVTWERVVLDFHSGRLFGSVGVWLVDLFALGLVFSSVSGLWLWLGHRRPHRRRKRQLRH